MFSSRPSACPTPYVLRLSWQCNHRISTNLKVDQHQPQRGSAPTARWISTNLKVSFGRKLLATQACIKNTSIGVAAYLCTGLMHTFIFATFACVFLLRNIRKPPVFLTFVCVFHVSNWQKSFTSQIGKIESSEQHKSHRVFLFRKRLATQACT